MSAQVSKEIKIKICDDYEDGLNHAAIAANHNISREIVYTVINHYKRRGIKRDSLCKLTEQAVKDLRSWFNEDCMLTLSAARQKLKQVHDVEVGSQTIKKCLDGLLYSVNRMLPIPAISNTQDVLSRRQEYARNLQLLIRATPEIRNKIFFVHGIVVKVGTRVFRGQIEDEKREKRIKHYAICAAMSCQRVFMYELNEKRPPIKEECDADFFRAFLEKVIIKLVEDRIDKPIFIIDNVTFPDITDAIFRPYFNHLSVFKVFPTDSPFLNPVETMFNQLRNHVQKLQPETADAVFDNMCLIPEAVSENDCQSYFNEMLTYIERCAAKSPIN